MSKFWNTKICKSGELRTYFHNSNVINYSRDHLVGTLMTGDIFGNIEICLIFCNWERYSKKKQGKSRKILPKLYSLLIDIHCSCVSAIKIPSLKLIKISITIVWKSIIPNSTFKLEISVFSQSDQKIRIRTVYPSVDKIDRLVEIRTWGSVIT